MANGLAGQIDNYLKGKGSPMAGFGHVFVAAGKKHGVDPRLVVGIAGAESSFGKKNFAPHNAWGWGVHLDPQPSWDNWGAAISSVTRGLASGYISKGIRTPAEIVKIYAPSSDGNDESIWSGNVSTFMKELGASPAAATAKTTAATPSTPSAPSTTVPSFTLPKLPELPPLQPSTSGLRGALIANLGLTAQRGHSSGQGLLSGVLQGQMADTQADEAAIQQRSAYEKEREEYMKALAAATAAAPQSAPQSAPKPATAAPPEPDTSTDSTPTGVPASGKVIGTPYTGTHTLGNWESDNAVDVAMPTGTPLRAIADGVIGSQFGSLGTSGRFQGLRLHLSSQGNEWYYAHLSKFAPGIAPGVRVKAGQILGYSGVANGVEHLHLGQRNGSPLDRYRNST